jgi:hypothetical protein
MPKQTRRIRGDRKQKRLERLGQVIEVLNKVIVSLAILVGGGWALYKYVIMESPTAQVAVAELKRICSERGSLDIKMETNTKRKMIVGRVVVKNIGTREVDLDMQNVPSPLTVAKLDSSDIGKLTSSRSLTLTVPFTVGQNGVEKLDIFYILPGRTLELPFITPALDTGAYLISFVGGPRETIPDDEVCKNLPTPTREKPAYWAAAAIHWVEDAADSRLPAIK